MRARACRASAACCNCCVTSFIVKDLIVNFDTKNETSNLHAKKNNEHCDFGKTSCAVITSERDYFFFTNCTCFNLLCGLKY